MNTDKVEEVLGYVTLSLLLSIGVVGISSTANKPVEIEHAEALQMAHISSLEVEQATTQEIDVETLKKPEVDENELYILAHIIYAEAGSDWISDTAQLYVGSVLLNRKASPYYPNTLEECIYQSGQYGCVWNGSYYKEPNQRAWDNARYLLENGSQLPVDVIGQTGGAGGSGTYAVIDGIYFNFR